MSHSPFSLGADGLVDKAGKLCIIQVQVTNSGSSPMSESCGKIGVGFGPQWACVRDE